LRDRWVKSETSTTIEVWLQSVLVQCDLCNIGTLASEHKLFA
jgi:hypothetical protein